MRAVLIGPEAMSTGRTLEYLRRVGFEVHQADDVVTAADHCVDETVDLIVIDAGNDRESGLSVLESAREEALLASLRLLMVCGAGSQADIAEAMRIGADECVPAPLDWESFASKISLLGFDLLSASGSESD